MKVSLISTTFNDAKTVDGWIDSLSPQVTGEVEWIIADAHSTDGTWEAIERYAKQDQNVTAIRFVRGSGRLNRGEGRNLAARFASGDTLVHAIDADVYYRAGAIALVVKDFIANGRVPTGGDSFFCVDRGQFQSAGGYPQIQREEDFKLYDKLKKLGFGFRASRLNIWHEDHNDVRPLRNLAKIGTDEDRTEAIR